MEFWIDHPAADSTPVGFRRWFRWWCAEKLAAIARRLNDRADRLEWSALYPNERFPHDDIPF